MLQNVPQTTKIILRGTYGNIVSQIRHIKINNQHTGILVSRLTILNIHQIQRKQMKKNQSLLQRNKMEDASSEYTKPQEQVFMGAISNQLANYFNHVIDAIIQKRNKTTVSSRQKYNDLSLIKNGQNKSSVQHHKSPKKTKQSPSQSKKLDQAEQMKEMKEIHKLYKQKENKLQNKPKKPVSSFFMFYQDNKGQMANQHGEVIGARIAQLVAENWRKLTPQQKKPYFQRAQETKQRYKEQMGKFIQQHADEIEEIKQLKRIKNNKMRRLNRKKRQNESLKAQADSQSSEAENVKGISQKQIRLADRKHYPHRPKAPVSSFFIFYQENLSQMKAKHGEAIGSKLAKLASVMWVQMPAAAKKKFQQKAKEERMRYHQQMQQYKIDYPQEIENRRKKISDKMKRKIRIEKGIIYQKEQKNEGVKQSSSSSSSSDSAEDTSSVDSEDDEDSDSYQSSQAEDQVASPTVAPIMLTTKKIKQKKEKKQDKGSTPHKPRGPICSFFQYYHANVKEFMKASSNGQKDPGSQFVRRASTKWKTLSEQQKQPYHDLAKTDRERYQKQMQSFKQTYPAQYQKMKSANKSKHQAKKKVQMQIVQVKSQSSI